MIGMKNRHQEAQEECGMKCKNCGNPIPESRLRCHSIYCSNKCRIQCQNKLYKDTGIKSKVPTGTIGCISELRVPVDLMRRGLSVFRALSPSCSCDLVVLYGRRLLRIEVTTGKEQPNTGRIYHSHMRDDGSKFDVLAIMLPDAIIYKPDVEELLDYDRKNVIIWWSKRWYLFGKKMRNMLKRCEKMIGNRLFCGYGVAQVASSLLAGSQDMTMLKDAKSQPIEPGLDDRHRCFDCKLYSYKDATGMRQYSHGCARKRTKKEYRWDNVEGWQVANHRDFSPNWEGKCPHYVSRLEPVVPPERIDWGIVPQLPEQKKKAIVGWFKRLLTRVGK